MSFMTLLTLVVRVGAIIALLLPGTACAGQPANTPPTTTPRTQTAPSPTAVALVAPVVINEILAHTDPPQIDSIELYNPTDQPANIGGWFISENKDIPDRFRVPIGTIMPAGGYVVFTEAELGFRFSEFGETAYLFAPNDPGDPGALVDKVEFGVSPNGVSLGRYVTSTNAWRFPLQSAVTLGAVNAGPLVGPLVMSTVMYHPTTGSEYVVITNIGATPVNLYDPQHPENTWKLSGLGDNNADYALPPALVLGPGANLVVAADPSAFRAGHGEAIGVPVVGPFPGKLSNEGERLALMNPQPPELNANMRGFIAYADMDVVEYSATLPWPPEANGQGKALLRSHLDQFGDDPANWRAGDAVLQSTHLMMLPLIMP